MKQALPSTERQTQSKSFPRAYVLVVDGDSLAAAVFVCAHMLMYAPVAAPATADTPLASSNNKKRQQSILQQYICGNMKVQKPLQQFSSFTFQ